jgi:hypothetical protein
LAVVPRARSLAASWLLARLSNISKALFKSSAKLLTKSPSRAFPTIEFEDTLGSSDLEGSVPTTVLMVTGVRRGADGVRLVVTALVVLGRGVKNPAVVEEGLGLAVRPG